MDDPDRADDADCADPPGRPSRNAPRHDGWQTRVLGERLGRTRVAALVGVVGFWIVAPNLPASPVRDELASLWRPAEITGLEQDWAVFSPNPRNQSLDVRARVEYDDGTIEFWDVPEFDPTIGALREYRWNKWQERVRLEDHAPYWEPTAEWIAAQRERDGERPVRVTLIRRWVDHEPLTADGPSVNVGWNEFEFYVWERDS